MKNRFGLGKSHRTVQ